MIEIRECTLADLPYIYEICWKTGYNGGSIEDFFTDKYKLGHYFAAPYLHYELECCFVVTVDNIPKGYILGTTDTKGFTQWLNTRWLPSVRKLYSFEEGSELHSFEQFADKCLSEDTPLDPDLTDYPAHLHIDLLPELQGKGMGRKMMETFFKRCREKGADKLHLGVSKRNPAAIAFYQRLGMYAVKETEGAYMLGYDL